jgi:CBS-domain-containing membrane protein
MRVNEVMTKIVVTTSPQATVAEALDLMARSGVSGLPVVDQTQKLVGIVSDADFLRRPEITTLGREGHWYENFFLPGRSAAIYAHTHGSRVSEVMSTDVATIEDNADLNQAIDIMETRHVKRLPVVRGGKMIGIVARVDIVRALANSLRLSPGEKHVTDAEIKRDIEAELHAQTWAPIASLDVRVKDGRVVILGALRDERVREAVLAVAENAKGVVAVQDSMTLIEPYLMTPFV